MNDRVNQGILKSHLKTLIALSESNDPVFSFYLNLDRPVAATLHAVKNELRQMRHLLTASSRPQSLEVEAVVAHFIAKEAHPLSKSAAIFVRAGEQPFYLPIQFQLPIDDRITIDAVPHIVPLIEFRDRYDRYVVLVSNEKEARIFEIVLGEVSKAQWLARPELRKRIGREWTREHYRNQRRGETDRFIQEKIALLKQVFSRGGYGHLILSGEPEWVARVEAALPKVLREKVIETLPDIAGDGPADIVMPTIQAFVAEETQESKQNLKRLEDAVLSDGNAAIGIRPCEQALEQRQVDMLLITQNEENATPQNDADYSRLRVHRHTAKGGNKQATTIANRREGVLKMAIEQDIPVEFVSLGSFLDNFDGVGVLLRFKQALTQN